MPRHPGSSHNPGKKRKKPSLPTAGSNLPTPGADLPEHGSSLPIPGANLGTSASPVFDNAVQPFNRKRKR